MKKTILLLIIIIICTSSFFLLKKYLNNRNNISPVMHLDEPVPGDELNIDESNNNKLSTMMHLLAQSVPGIKLDMNNLSAEQLLVVNKVQERADQYGGTSIKGKIVTEI